MTRPLIDRAPPTCPSTAPLLVFPETAAPTPAFGDIIALMYCHSLASPTLRLRAVTGRVRLTAPLQGVSGRSALGDAVKRKRAP